MSDTFARELRKAQEELEAGKIDLAAERYEKILYQDQNNIPALLGITKIALQTASYDEALKFSEKILELDPENPHALLLKAKSLVSLGKIEEGWEFFKKALERAPDDFDVLLAIGEFLFNREMYKEAQEFLQKAVEIKSDHYLANFLLAQASLKLGEHGMAAKHFREALQIDNRLETYLGLAESLSAAGEFVLADGVLDEAIKYYGMNPEILIKKSGINFARGKIDEAVKFAKKLCEKVPNNARAWLNLGQLLFRAEDLEGAEKALLRAKQLEPENWEPYFNLGSLYEAVGLPKEAEESYRRAIQLNPNAWEPYNNLGLLLLGSDEHAKHLEAEEMFRKAVELTGRTDPSPLLNLTLALLKLGKKAEAKKIYEQLLSIKIDDEEIREQVKRLKAEF